MEILQKIALVFTIIGAIVWGLIGVFDFNLVATIFGDGTLLSRIIYSLVGIAGLINIYLLLLLMEYDIIIICYPSFSSFLILQKIYHF